MRWFRNRKDLRSIEPLAAFETLEQRLALYQGPMISGMPPIASLENQFDTVVRINTNLGNIDIELFDSQAAAAVANFKAYVNAGLFDEMMFEKMAAGILQAGKYKFNDGSGLRTITAKPAIANGFTRSNIARTLAMVPDTGTTTSSRWIINLQDNPALNTLSGGYTVFGKVVQGWNIVQAIAALTTRDLDQPLTGTNPNPGPFDAVPTTTSYNSNVGPTEATLVRLIDIEVVKSNGTARYYEQTLVFPEGFRGANIVERIDMENLDSRPNFYQVIVRYETGERDSVVLSGVMQPNARISLKINDANFPNYNIVRSGVGYAFEIRTLWAFAASLNHRDSGVTIGESFQILARLFPGQLTKWTFGGGEKGPLFSSYVLVQNLTSQDGTVNFKFTSQNGTVNLISMPLKAARRGGIAVHTLPNLPDGAYSVLVSATIPIVASLSMYETGGPGNLTNGSAELGTITGGAIEGFLAGVQTPTGGASQLDFYYADNSIAAIFVDTVFTLGNGTELQGNPVLLTSAQRRATRTFAQLNPTLPVGQFFSVRFVSRNGVTPLTASYSAVVAGDRMSTPFQTIASGKVTFADGFTDPTLSASDFSETISVFNPYANDPGFIYDIAFHFTDGAVIFGGASSGTPFFSLQAHKRRDHKATDFAAVAAKINSNPNFRFYSIEIVSTFTTPHAEGGAVAQITRFHNTWGQILTSIPAFHANQPLWFLNDAQFH